jgi:hypothetical protein
MTPISIEVWNDWPMRYWWPRLHYGWDQYRTVNGVVLMIGRWALCFSVYVKRAGITRLGPDFRFRFRMNLR